MKKSNCGKWILSGEHSVLRGGSIVLFPIYRMQLEVQYEDAKEFHCCFGKGFSSSQSDIFKEVIKKAFSKVGQKKQGVFHLHSNIPLGCGLGSSAAFCLSVSQIFFKQSWIQDVLGFAMELENFFHQESSGADVLVSFHKKPLIFKVEEPIKELHLSWKPHLYLYNTQYPSSTRDCVNQVTRFVKKFPKESRLIDQQMSESVNLAIQALTSKSENHLEYLRESINKAYYCFKKWNLLKNLESKVCELKDQGALAVKPTGAGQGGVLLSLWKKPLSEDDLQKNQLIPALSIVNPEYESHRV